ncbi:proline-, glutamic acid- and leucine-rich protein 1-like [Scyliorhinus canicula]|uniref:proline-, glutamic acid- and leucine-rich protein 1-like n=1 Tax=Scyliorhinus canicula TaxID=7830 RepID=UPI0018F65CC8|nr:proline-, glutamic acid- and leucine-rich protein 1-like [Scyliorhinus canicula]
MDVRTDLGVLVHGMKEGSASNLEGTWNIGLQVKGLGCRKHLLRFADIICRLFPQLLTAWGTPRDGAVPGQEKAYSSVRVKVYEVLATWVKVCGASSGVLQGSFHHSDILLANMIADITPVADTTKLRAGKPAGDGAQPLSYSKHSNKKQKLMDLNDASAMSGHKKQDVTANSDVSLAALKVCSHVILSCGSLVKEETHKKLHELVLPLLIRLQQGVGKASPYLRADCRRELYRLLLFLLLVPNSKWPPPLHCAVRIFSRGQNDGDTEVSAFCSEALVICNCLIHPRVPSLQLPLNTASLIAAAFKPSVPDLQAPGRQPQVPTFHLPAPPARPQSDPLAGLTSQGRFAGLPTPGRFPLPLAAAGSAENHAPEGEMETEVATQQDDDALFGNGGHRPVFVRYDKEEESDVEISLESDSDDSVMIVPEGLLPERGGTPEAKKEEVEEIEKVVVTSPPQSQAPSAVPDQAPAPAPPPAQPAAQLAAVEEPKLESQEGDEELTVININSSEDEEGEEYPEDEDDYYDDEEEDYEDEEDFEEGEMEDEEEEEEEDEDEMDYKEIDELEEDEEDEIYGQEGMSEEDELPPELTVQIQEIGEVVPVAVPAADEDPVEASSGAYSAQQAPPSAQEDDEGEGAVLQQDEGALEEPPDVRQEEQSSEVKAEVEKTEAAEQPAVTEAQAAAGPLEEPVEEAAPREEPRQEGEACPETPKAASDGDKADVTASEGLLEEAAASDKGSTEDPDEKAKNGSTTKVTDAGQMMAEESTADQPDEEETPTAKTDEAKGQDDPTVAMLADFVDCPPDEEEKMEVQEMAGAAEEPSTSS